MWEFLKWFFEEFLDKLGFNQVMITVAQRFQLSRAATWNILSELVIATLILVYVVVVALRGWPNDIMKAIDRLLLFAVACAVFVASEKFWK